MQNLKSRNQSEFLLDVVRQMCIQVGSTRESTVEEVSLDQHSIDANGGFSRTYLCKTRVHHKVKKASKELVSHQNGKEKVSEHKSTSVVPGVFPNIESREDNASQVEGHDGNIELSVDDSEHTTRQNAEKRKRPDR